MRFWMVMASLVALLGCAEPVPSSGKARIIATGDSLLAWNAASNRSVVSVLEKRLGTGVVDRSVVGARYHYVLPISGSLGLRIGSQYATGRWDWAIMNGGGNDLWLGCGCSKCDAQLNRLISADGTRGTVVDSVRKARSDGAQVIFVGYLRTPGQPSMIDHCREIGDAYEARLATNGRARHRRHLCFHRRSGAIWRFEFSRRRPYPSLAQGQRGHRSPHRRGYAVRWQGARFRAPAGV